MEKGLEVFYWFGVPTRIACSVLGLTSVIGKEARVPLGYQHSQFTKGGRKVLKVQVDNWGLEVKEYLGAKVLVGEEGNSFYGSRLGNSFRWASGGLVFVVQAVDLYRQRH